MFNSEAKEIQKQGKVPGLPLSLSFFKRKKLLLPETCLNYYKSIYVCGMKFHKIKIWR